MKGEDIEVVMDDGPHSRESEAAESAWQHGSSLLLDEESLLCY